MSTSGHLKFQGTNRATFVGTTSNIMFDTTSTSLGIGVTGTDHPSSNLYVTGNAYVSSNIAVGGVLTMGTVNVVARHDLEAVTALGNTTPVTLEFTNPTTSLVASGNVVVTGNVTADHFVGDGSNITGISSNLDQIVNIGNVTSNTVQFSNAITSLTAASNVVVTGNVTAGSFLGDGSELTALNADNIASGTIAPARIPTLNAISTGAITSSGDIKGGCPVYFSARMTGNIAASHAGNRIAWNTLDDSRGGGFSTSSGTFTAPIAGRYKFSYFLRGNVNDAFKIKPRINGSPSFNTTNDGTNQNLLGSAFVYNDGRAGSAVFITYLNAGGTVDLHACTHGNSHSSGLATYYNGFTGEYLSSL